MVQVSLDGDDLFVSGHNVRDYADVCYVEDNITVNNAAHTNIKDLADVAACNFEVQYCWRYQTCFYQGRPNLITILNTSANIQLLLLTLIETISL